MADAVTSWLIWLGGALLAMLALASKNWLATKVDLLLNVLYGRLTSSPLLRRRNLAKYTKELYRHHKEFPVSFKPDEALKLPMASVYVPLRGGAPNDEGRVGLDESLRRARRSVVLGVPGAGKTLLLRHETFMWAWRHIQNGNRVRFGGLRDIPVLLELHQLNKDPEPNLEQHIVRRFSRHGFPQADTWVAGALGRGDLVLYFDGLDEVSTELRDRVVEMIKEFADTYAACRIVVTCRLAVYEGQLKEFDQTLQVQEFDEYLIRRFLSGWPWRMRTAADTVDQLLGALRDSPQIMSLARSPLLLTMIANLYDSKDADLDQVLPHTRAGFYRRVIASLLDDNSRSTFSHPLKKAVLQQLALAAQDIPSGTHDRLALPETMVLNSVRAVLEQQAQDPPPPPAEEVLKEIVQRSGLLLSVDNGERYQFAHLTLQEYLAAETLAADATCLLHRYEADPEVWRETVRLWCGVVGQRDCTEFVRAVFEQDRALAFQCLADAHTVDDELTEEILAHFEEHLGSGDETVIAAFGQVASDLRERGARVFDFLVCTVRSAGDSDRAHAAARALAMTNLPKAVAELAPLAQEPDDLAWRALIRMGDLAVPVFSLKASRYPEAVQALWSIRTPHAALALNQLLWSCHDTEKLLLCAFHLGELLTIPEVAAELRAAPVPANAEHLDWVWRPFARGPEDALVKIAGRIAAIIDRLEPEEIEARNDLPAPDPRIIAALVVIGRNDEPERLRNRVVIRSEEVAACLSSVGDTPQAGSLQSPPDDDLRTALREISHYLEPVPTLVDGTPELRYPTVAVHTAQDLSPRRSALRHLLPQQMQHSVNGVLAYQHDFAGPENWDVPPHISGVTRYNYSRSPHYRFVLLICLVVSGVAAWRALEAGTGDRPWGPTWLGFAVLVQIAAGWLVLSTRGALVNSWDLWHFGFRSVVTFVEALKEARWNHLWAFGTLGLLPAVCVYSYIALMQLHGVFAATGTAALAIGACLVVGFRGMQLEYREFQRSHSVRFVVEALL